MILSKRYNNMYTRIVFNPYKNGCEGLSLIKEKLKEKQVKILEIKRIGSKYKQKRKDLIIPWGVQHGGKLNQLSSFRNSNIPCSDWTTHYEEASGWIEREYRVLCRTILNGHGGDGIVVASSHEELIDNCPLYVKYVPKQREFRVHLVLTPHRGFQYEFKVREKRRRAGWQELEGFNKYVRNHDNGWVFCDELKDELPEDLLDVCLGAVQALGLQFGAVDVGYHDVHGYCVYEVNTAPGCDNATAEWYADCFRDML
jgi:hypothetical protein